MSKARAWPVAEYNKVKRIDINSFGYGGANAHVILKSGARFMPSSKPALLSLLISFIGRIIFLLSFSGNSEATLKPAPPISPSIILVMSPSLILLILLSSVVLISRDAVF